MQEKWGKCFIKYLIIMVFALYWAWGVSKKKSQYPADGAEYCDFTFLLYKSFLFDAFFYRLQYLVENHYIVLAQKESAPLDGSVLLGLLDNNLDYVVVNLHKL